MGRRLDGQETVVETARSIFPTVEKADDERTADLLTRGMQIHEEEDRVDAAQHARIERHDYESPASSEPEVELQPAMSAPNRVELLLEAAAKDKALIADIGAAVLDSQVYVLGATAGSVPSGEALKEDTAVRLVMIDTPKGPIIPFFSSKAVMNLVLDHHPGTERRYVRLSGRNLFEMTQGHNLVLNPDRPHSKVFTSTEIANLLARPPTDPGRPT